MKNYLRAAAERELVINAAQRPAWSGALNSTRYRGELATVLPGIYAIADRRHDFDVRIAALRSSDHEYIVTGRAAARLTWWPEIECEVVGVAHPVEVAPSAGFAFEQRRIGDHLQIRVAGLRVTTPALTVLDLITELGPEAVDEALRRRAVTVADLKTTLALTPKRRGNQLRRQVVADSRDAPWSQLERLGHRLLREAGIRGWRTNHRVEVHGAVYYLDVAWPGEKVAVEFDGFTHHGTRESFHYDRLRDARLAAAGWRVIRFSAENLEAMPETVRAVLRLSRR
ncbi:endonuclease domain-containing protein [Tessaracoccus palaemonis]|uniref:Endonuclease domain-containing protein n=1 Tax=Tessaracoccus palaemonis TaxID=2829499 RepID=A0ABX8SHE4_9ACTN|nr:DUF559 domain-containing protein [Tessaracoccus palaemonis]QXT62832.1 endonuclease domain-containing protein [Tessaracoccus palaemonis]